MTYEQCPREAGKKDFFFLFSFFLCGKVQEAETKALWKRQSLVVGKLGLLMGPTMGVEFTYTDAPLLHLNQRFKEIKLIKKKQKVITDKVNKDKQNAPIRYDFIL